MVLVAGRASRNGQLPAAERVEQLLQSMAARVPSGPIKRFLALDAASATLQFFRTVAQPRFSNWQNA